VIQVDDAVADVAIVADGGECFGGGVDRRGMASGACSDSLMAALTRCWLVTIVGTFTASRSFHLEHTARAFILESLQ
jgi:hypothetical protein